MREIYEVMHACVPLSVHYLFTSTTYNILSCFYFIFLEFLLFSPVLLGQNGVETTTQAKKIQNQVQKSQEKITHFFYYMHQQ